MSTMNSKYANELAHNLRECVTDMVSIVRYPTFTRENIEHEAMDTLGRLMMAREKHITLSPVLHIEPAINTIYEHAVYELHEVLLWYANEYEHEKANSCPETLDDVCKIIWEASRLYRHETTEENE